MSAAHILIHDLQVLQSLHAAPMITPGVHASSFSIQNITACFLPHIKMWIQMCIETRIFPHIKKDILAV